MPRLQVLQVVVSKTLFIHLPIDFKGYNIVHLKMLNVMVALKVWGHMWTNTMIDIHCDNLAVVLNSGASRDAMVATCARNIWFLTAMFNINVRFLHISGATKRVTDLLSRWTASPDDSTLLHKYVNNPVWMNTHIDLTLLNHSI